jgi:hypothetical protein
VNNLTPDIYGRRSTEAGVSLIRSISMTALHGQVHLPGSNEPAVSHRDGAACFDYERRAGQAEADHDDRDQGSQQSSSSSRSAPGG